MNYGAIRRVILLGVVCLVGIIAMQTYWVISTWNLNEEEFNNKVKLALYRVASSLAGMNGAELPSREVIKQRANNYFIVNIANEFEGGMLEHLLQKEFEALALDIDYEYAVFDCHTNEMVYGGLCSATPEQVKPNIELGRLPKEKDANLTYYFGVKFPTRSGFLLDRMQLSIFLSGVLVLTLLFFVYSMSVILRQKRLSEMQKDFINNMTHEFKTPLSTIRISAGVFARDEHIRQDARLSKYAEIILEQNDRLNQQVEKVLQLAKIEQGNFNLKKETCSLAEILAPVLDSTHLRIEAAGGRLITHFPAELPIVEADRLHLSNVLYNLLDNAIKYCRAAPEATLRVWQEADCVLISIADNGIGISREHQQRVFDKFYRVPTGDVHDVKGFGLGLFYVKRICDAHGWKIKLASIPSEGTTITLMLKKRTNKDKQQKTSHESTVALR